MKKWYLLAFTLIFCVPLARGSDAQVEQALLLESAIHKDDQYHFQMNIPDFATYDKTFPGGYFFPSDEWRINGGKQGAPIIRIPYFIWGKPGSGGPYYVYEVRIGMSSATIDLATCTKDARATKKINNKTFYIFHDQDVGMNQYLDVVSYRTIYQGQCFAIEQVHYASNSLIANQLDKAQLQNGTQAIIQTFKFTTKQ